MIYKSHLKIFSGLAVTFVAVSSASMYMRKLLEDKLFNQDICQRCIDLLEQHSESVDILGPPLNFKRPNLRNTFNNITNTDASIALVVSGSKTAGNLLIKASKVETDREWILKALTLEVPNKKVIIKNGNSVVD